jgi:hypothetical protein
MPSVRNLRRRCLLLAVLLCSAILTLDADAPPLRTGIFGKGQQEDDRPEYGSP